MTPLQRRMMKKLLSHPGKLNAHIKNLDEEIDHFMKPEEKQASGAIQTVTGISNTSAQTIVAVIGTDMSRFLTDKLSHHGQGFVPETMKARISGSQEKLEKGMNCCERLCLTVYIQL